MPPTSREHRRDSSAMYIAKSSGCLGVQWWAGAAVPGGCCYLFQSICGSCPGETVNTERCDLVTVVNCKILQIKAHLAAQGWQIFASVVGAFAVCIQLRVGGGRGRGRIVP